MFNQIENFKLTHPPSQPERENAAGVNSFRIVDISIRSALRPSMTWTLLVTPLLELLDADMSVDLSIQGISC